MRMREQIIFGMAVICIGISIPQGTGRGNLLVPGYLALGQQTCAYFYLVVGFLGCKLCQAKAKGKLFIHLRTAF